MTTEYSLEEIERFDRTWTDQFAKDCGWEAHELKDPVDDLNLFFGRLPGEKMLDAGCGWGRYVFRFLDHGLNYEGIDHSVEMLRVAQATNPDARFVEGTFRTLPYESESFDGVWSCCALAAIPKAHLMAILQEHARVLKRDGVMMIVMPLTQYSEEMMYKDDDGNPEIYQAHYHLDEFEEHVRQAGLTILESDYRWTNGSFFVLTQKIK